MKSDNSIDLITACLDYPELNTVKLDKVKNLITFELAINTSSLDSKLYTIEKLKKCLYLYHRLKGITAQVLNFEIKPNQTLSFIRLKRDIETMNLDELNLFISLTNKFWGDILVKDEHQYGKSINKKFFKKNLVEQLHSNNNSSCLVYRENGKIIVHNR